MNKTGKVLIKPVNNKDHKQDYEYLYSTKNGGFVAGPSDDYNIRRNYDDYEDEEEASIFFIDANGVKTPIDNNATSAYFEQYEKAKNKYPLYMPFWQSISLLNCGFKTVFSPFNVFTPQRLCSLYAKYFCLP